MLKKRSNRRKRFISKGSGENRVDRCSGWGVQWKHEQKIRNMTTITNVLENLTQNRPTIHVATVCGFLCLFFPSFSTRSRWFRSVFAGWASPFVEALIFFYGSSHLPSFYSPSVYVVQNVAGRHRTLSEEEQTKEN